MHQEARLSAVLSVWQKELTSLYPENEITALYKIALEDLCGLSRHDQLIQWDSVQSAETIAVLQNTLDRLKTGEPLQHIVGFTYFDDLKIFVSPEVLIPRPETEELVYEVVRSLPKDFSGKIVDWCTGSGCIALALKKHFPHAEVIGYDISISALEVARKNAVQLGLEVSFVEKDALSEEDELSSEIDVIISNPPYIPDSERAAMHRNVTDFEPGLALFVPDNSPLLFYETIALKALRCLKPDGYLFFELHENYANETLQMVEATKAFSSVIIINDLQGKQRMLKARRI